MNNINSIDLKMHEQFYKLPKFLIDDEKYKKLSLKAIFLYSLMRDRLELSQKNNWEDNNGLYIFFSVEEISKKLRCSDPVSIKTKKELASNNLIEEVKQFNLPNKIYLKKIKDNKETLGNSLNNFSYVNKETLCNNLNNLSELHKETLGTGIKKLKPNNTNINNTNINNTDINNSSSSNNIYIDLKNKTTDATADNSLKNLFDYYQERIGLIDSFQYQMILEYVKEDGMAIEIIEKAIGKAADNGKRNFNYVNSILKNWKQSGITTLAQVESEERSFSRKVKNNKHGSDHSGIYDPSDVDLLF